MHVVALDELARLGERLGRPPARDFTSSQYIWNPSFMSLPSGAMLPVSTYRKPILIGSCASAEPAASAAPSTASQFPRNFISAPSSLQCDAAVYGG